MERSGTGGSEARGAALKVGSEAWERSSLSVINEVKRNDKKDQ